MGLLSDVLIPGTLQKGQATSYGHNSTSNPTEVVLEIEMPLFGLKKITNLGQDRTCKQKDKYCTLLLELTRLDLLL